MAAKLSALRAGRTLLQGFFIFKVSWYSFLLEAESNLTSKVIVFFLEESFHDIRIDFVACSVTGFGSVIRFIELFKTVNYKEL
jgi:hypothetical protein